MVSDSPAWLKFAQFVEMPPAVMLWKTQLPLPYVPLSASHLARLPGAEPVSPPYSVLAS